jgi:hypothetical protein
MKVSAPVLIAAAGLFLASCAGEIITLSTDPPSSGLDCQRPPDARPIPAGAVILRAGRIAVGYREFHVASRACDIEVVVGGGEPIVFGGQPVPWIAHAAVPRTSGPTSRLRLVITRLRAGLESAVRDVDFGVVQADPLGNLDPRDGWAAGDYRIRLFADVGVLAEGAFTVVAPASIAP